MKYLFAILLFIQITQLSFGQGCGIYRIKCIGTLEIDSLTTAKVILPTPFYLHDIRNEYSELLFAQVEPNGNKIELLLSSEFLTSDLDAQMLKQIYKRKSETLPIKLLLGKKGIIEERMIDLDWNSVEIKKFEDTSIGLFEIDLKEIKIK